MLGVWVGSGNLPESTAAREAVKVENVFLKKKIRISILKKKKKKITAVKGPLKLQGKGYTDQFGSERAASGTM